jgi:hypothetical protein
MIKKCVHRWAVVPGTSDIKCVGCGRIIPFDKKWAIVGFNEQIDENGEGWMVEEKDSYVTEDHHIGEAPFTLKEWSDLIAKKYPKKPYRMCDEVFEILVSDTFEMCKNTLIRKATEYAREDGRLHNFHVAGMMSRQSPEKALLGMMLKHDVSIRDIVEDLDRGIFPTDELLTEKITDLINYHVLLKALIVERRGGKP